MIKGVEGQRVIVDRSWRTMVFAKNARSQRSHKSISFLPAPADDIDPDATRRSKAPKSNEHAGGSGTPRGVTIVRCSGVRLWPEPLKAIVHFI